VLASFVAEEGVQLDQRHLIKACRARLENFMVPHEIVFVDDLPRTESGKIRKKSLSRDPLEEQPATRLRAL
jgi:long-chain acyl-CoA synthetase